MKKVSEAERRAALAAERVKETKDDIASRFLSYSGGRRLATFPNHFGLVSKGPVDLTQFDKHPGLSDALAFGYVMHSLGVPSADRRYYVAQNIKSGFLSFLDDQMIVGLDIGDITTKTLRDFKKWLDDETSNGYCGSKLTRKIKIQDLQLVLKQLMADKRWSARLSPELKLLDNLYSGSNRDIEHTEILDDTMVEMLFISAAADCEATMRLVEARDEAFDMVLKSEGASDAKSIAGDPLRCAAFLLHRFEGKPPSWYDITRTVALARSMDEALYRSATEVLYPSLDELLPFVLLLATLFAFNPGVILNMTHSDYDDDTFAGRPRIRLFPYKPRKHGNHRNSVLKTDDYDNPAKILSFLEKRTERVRKLLRLPIYSDRVFIRYSAHRTGVPLEVSDKAWREALARFCERHGLDVFTLQQIRPTTLDLVHEITGGNLMSTQQVAGHASIDTTKEFYTSTAMQRRDEEMLGSGINQLWRFVSTQGKVDPTERDRLNVDLGAATPGFACADPYDSPMGTEKKGVLCGAYGHCPMCEHAMIDLASPHAYAYQRELLRRIDEAQATLGPPWIPRWSPVKAKLLTRCLAAFPRETILAAGNVSIPPLPEVD
ncbi:hypothetical protein C8J46_10927 [Sphingomonas sp. PP-F2F-A104-K0414]|uniref:hypothetical protein n=1 Tax=Sphingomonas sp. PP-F2F-A104-K0414 TaxID=2135661 RepID=UPI00104F20A2|nr:hypothetical protein [Sphingomonas sp. PP-F2F-A104-K0414]TCP96332.1 hypothetical protein C8J46_10927 [Sphingomonas sp. PP-F2F-A104-K0414]